AARLIMCFLRHLDEADAERTLDAALPFRDRIVGVGLDSSERGNPPGKFTRVFARARDAGFFLTAHAGEEGPPSYVWEALDLLGVARIDHGVRAMEGQALVGRLARRPVPLTVCPLSNVGLRVADDLAHHPLRRMLDKGLMVTVNSDDPAYFGGYVNENYRASAQASGLARDEIAAIVRNGIKASLISTAEKDKALAEVDRVLAESARGRTIRCQARLTRTYGDARTSSPPQQEPEHQPVRDQEQRYDDGWNEVGGTQLTRCEPDGVALIESVEEIGGAPQVEHPDQGHPPPAPQAGQREQGEHRGDEIT